MKHQKPIPAPAPPDTEPGEASAASSCSLLADDFESPPPYRCHETKNGLWVVLDAHGDSVLWADKELPCLAAAEALNQKEALADLIEQWERRAKTADKLANDAAGAGDWTINQRCKTKAGVIRSMTAELKRELSQGNAPDQPPAHKTPQTGRNQNGKRQ